MVYCVRYNFLCGCTQTKKIKNKKTQLWKSAPLFLKDITMRDPFLHEQGGKEKNNRLNVAILTYEERERESFVGSCVHRDRGRE